MDQHQLTELIFAEVASLVEKKRLLLKSGTTVDAAIIAAPPSTKNEQGARDPEMHPTMKGKDWHLGMKAHIGTDGAEREVFGDQAYWNEPHCQAALVKSIRYGINRRSPRRPLSRYQR